MKQNPQLEDCVLWDHIHKQVTDLLNPPPKRNIFDDEENEEPPSKVQVTTNENNNDGSTDVEMPSQA